MAKLKLLILFFLISITSHLSAQQISGQVVDSGTNEALISAVVRNVTSGDGVITDLDGKFIINASPNDILQVTYVGYLDQEVTVGTDTQIQILLVPDNESLEEIVVIGYGTQKKSEVTGSVSYVNSETIEDIKPFNVQEALQGTAPGVKVTAQSGAPGAGFNIRIRGIGTNLDAQPLVIIDGYKGDIGLLNPADIESMTILKDAQAAIYGAQAANGVVLITTKSGKFNQQTKVTYDGYFGVQNTSRSIKMLDSQEYAVLLNESYASVGSDIPYPDLTQVPVGSNWQKDLFQRDVPVISNSLNITGGAEKVNYSLSGSLISQDGIVGGDKTGFNRGTVRGGMNIDLSDRIKLNSNLVYTNFNRKSVNDFGLGSVLFNALNAPPTLSSRDSNGDYTLIPSTTGLGIEIINPLAQVANTYNDYNLVKLNGTIGLDFEVVNGLVLTGRYGFNKANSKGKAFNPIVDYGGKVFDTQRSSVNQNEIHNDSYTIDVFATYNNSFNNIHNLETTLGTSFIKEYGNGLFATGYDVPYNSWDYADIQLAKGTSDDIDNGSYTYDNRIASVFGRLNYNFDSRYFVSALLRRDESTKFGPNNRVAWFPSVTTGWTVSNEEFFTSNAIDLFKVRFSYGELGNDRIEPDLFYGTLNPTGGVYAFNGQIVTTSAPGRIANPDIKWEASKKLDVGMDFEFLENKLNMTMDYYNNKRDDLLLSNTPISGITGYAAPGSGRPVVNVGGVQNSGFEFLINYKNQFSKNFFLSTAYNIGTVDNEVTYVYGENSYIPGGSFGVGNLPPARMEKGQPMGYYYGYQTAGVFQNQAEIDAHAIQNVGGATAQPGDLKYVDTNNDGVITEEDRVNIGSYIAPVDMGLNLEMNWKAFDFSMYTYSAIGNEIVRNYERALSDVNQLNYRVNRWHGQGTSNEVPRATAGASGNTVFSDFYVEDGSYMRIQTAQIGYTIPSTLTEKWKMNSFRFYVKGNNLYTFTDYKGYDPAATSGAPIGSGIDYGFYPQPRTILVGATLKF